MVGIIQAPPPANEEERLASRNKWLEAENKGLLQNIRLSADKIAKLEAESTLHLLRIKELEK